jgi:uncharacterized RDD family membrane protein YckC
MKLERATFSQRLSAFMITSMLTFAVTTIISPMSKTATESYVMILFIYLSILCVFYSKSSSPGKYIMKLQVISSIDNQPARFWRMFYRETIGKLISSFFYLGFIYALLNEDHLALHDIICKTYVVQIKAD